MGRLLLILFALGLIVSVIYFSVTTMSRAPTVEPPTQALQNVRESAKNIENDGMRRAADLDRKTENQQ